jgi:hypothetical protein
MEMLLQITVAIGVGIAIGFVMLKVLIDYLT